MRKGHSLPPTPLYGASIRHSEELSRAHGVAQSLIGPKRQTWILKPITLKLEALSGKSASPLL